MTNGQLAHRAVDTREDLGLFLERRVAARASDQGRIDLAFGRDVDLALALAHRARGPAARDNVAHTATPDARVADRTLQPGHHALVDRAPVAEVGAVVAGAVG